MLFAIKNEINECFIGVFQFFYYLKFKKYMPSIVIKEIFFFTRNGINFKTIKEKIKPYGRCEFYWTNYHKIPLKKWFIIAKKKNQMWHFMVLKKFVNKNIVFDPQKGLEKNVNLDKEIVFLDLKLNKEIPFSKQIKFFIPFDKMIIFNCLIATFLTIFLSFYFKIAIEAIALKQINYLITIIIVFTSFGFVAILWRSWSSFYLQNFLWKKVEDLYLRVYKKFYNMNNKLKTFFTFGQIQESINFGIEYYVYLIESHQQLFINLLIVFSTIVIIFYYYFYLLFTFLVFVFLSLFWIKRKQKTYYLLKKKVTNNNISINNHNFMTWQNLELAQGAFKNQYYQNLKTLKQQYFNVNSGFSKQNVQISTGFDFLLFFLNFCNFLIIFYLIYQKEMSIILAIFLIGICNMFYSNFMQILMFINNHKNHLNKFYKFMDVFTSFPIKQKGFSYNGQKYFNHNLPYDKGFYQISGENGVGKTTILKNYCHLFSKPQVEKIYLSKNHVIDFKPDFKILNKYFFAKNLDKPFYSSGEQQLINLISCLEKSFQVLILDEALLSITKEKRLKIYYWLQKNYKNKIIFVVDHQLQLKNIAKNIVI